MASLAPIWPLLVLTLPAAATQDTCPAAANQPTEQGWALYRSGWSDSARVRFELAVSSCPNHLGAQTGLAYALLQLGELDSALPLFTGVLDADPQNLDALIGTGLVAWRRGDAITASQIFERVLALEPENETARQFLTRTSRVLGTAPARPPIVRPDTTVLHARTHLSHFDVLSDGEWSPFYVKGINLGAAIPGNFATEFPDSVTYATWIEQIGAMGANTIRVYTIHPPRFYNALAAYNTAHDSPIRLIHGVWATLPPDNDYTEPTWRTQFFQELRDVVDLVHGRADLPPLANEGFRHYTADVSPWVVAFIFGREWEPQTIAGFNRGRGGRSDWSGRYMTIRQGTPAEVWMAQATEQMVAYEMDTYGSQRPTAFTNWPTLDPIRHTSEASNAEEVAIAVALGGAKYLDPEAPDQDASEIDASRMTATEMFPAGHFASYHAYPYHPDFMVLDSRLRQGVSPYGPSNYFGYLKALKDHHAGIPVLIAEYGVPASWGIAHLQPQGWHHGGHTESTQAAINERLTREIAAAGMAGGILFSWIDEWFKRTWIVGPMTLPEERNRLWYNRMDPEQHYGVMAMEPEQRIKGTTLAERREQWRLLPPLYDEQRTTVRATADEAYLWLFLERGRGQTLRRAFVGFDLDSPELGDHRWPSPVEMTAPSGLEFVMQFDGGSVEILADSAVNPWIIEPVYPSLPGLAQWTELDVAADVPPGAFHGRLQAAANIPFQSVANDDGRFTQQRVIVRRHRFARDTTEFPTIGYNRGVLRAGPPPDGAWELSADERALEVRIPWMLINITDPSSRNMLNGADGPLGPYRSRPINGITLTIAVESGEEWASIPANPEQVATFTWNRWEHPRWIARPRLQYPSIQRVFGELPPPAEHRGHP